MFKSAATKLAHNSTLPSLAGNKDLRPLQDLIIAEKAVLLSIQKLSSDLERAADAVNTWGAGEGEDLNNKKDILAGSTILLRLFSGALLQYSVHEQTMRDYMKAIRTREEALDELRKQRKSVISKAESADKRLIKMGSEHKNISAQTDLLQRLREEIQTLNWDIITEEAALGDYKRQTVRDWMSLKFGGLVECSEKGTIIGEIGKLLISEISLEPTQPGRQRRYYSGQPKTETLVSEARRCVADVTYRPLPPPDRTPSLQEQVLLQTPTIPSPLEQPQSYRSEPSEWSARGAEGETAPASGPAPNYLGTPPDQIGQGLGHFPQPSDLSAQSNFDSETATTGYSRETSKTYSVDDMGVTTQATKKQVGLGVDAGAGGEGGGGRFATFPAKNSSGGGGFGRGVALRDDRLTFPLRSGTEDTIRGISFEQAVNTALQEKFPTSTLSVPPSTQHGPKKSIDSSSSKNSDPFSRGPLHNPWRESTSQASASASSESVNSVKLAYATRSEEGPTKKSSRHVRFGGSSDEEEPKKRQHSPAGTSSERGRPTGARDASPQRPAPPTSGSQPAASPPHRIPPPNVSPSMFSSPLQHEVTQTPPLLEEEERARNTAAARDISRELELSPPETSQAANSERSPLSPLAPPILPFARRDMSPSPPTDMGSSKSRASDQSPSSRAPPDSPYQSNSPGSPRLHSSLPASPTTGRSSSPFPGSAEFQGRSSSASHSPLASSGAPGHPGLGPMSHSTPSLNMSAESASPTTRTIAAAAFKRNQGRSMSLMSPGMDPAANAGGDEGTGGYGPIGQTNPLTLRKYTLPVSPLPQRPWQALGQGAGRGPGPGLGSGPSGGPGVREGRHTFAEPDSFDPHRDDYRLPSPPFEDDDDQFDYLNAYVNNMGSGGDATLSNNKSGGGDGRATHGGYGHGR